VAREPRIVAELGRPETPEETAARKAENSRKHRANQTLRNLVASLVVTLAVVIALVLVVVRPDPATGPAIDYATVAAELEPTVDHELIAPRLPEGWTANAAETRTSGGVTSWYVGFVTPDNQFIALVQGLDANPTWLVTAVDQALPTGTVELDGVVWDVYDQRDTKDPGNHAYALVTTSGDSTIVLHGTAGDTEFATLATAIAADLPSFSELSELSEQED